VLVVVTGYYACQTKKQVDATLEMAKTTVKIAREDREFRLLEAKLQKAYQPTYEILRRAQFQTSRPDKGNYSIQKSELLEIQNIVVNYGHYLTRNLEQLLTVKIINDIPIYPPWKQEELTDYITYQPVDLDDVYNIVMSEKYELKKQLKELTKSQ
jgi:hypothetical protein